MTLAEGQRECSLSQLDDAMIVQFDRNIAVGLGYTNHRIHPRLNIVGDSGLFNSAAKGPQLFRRAGF